MSFKVKFWGVRGSIACPGPRHMVYGGNTSCVEVALDRRRLVLDAGTGIRELGRAFEEEGIRQATVLLSHTHWDHINGFPFFGPAFDPANRFHIMAGHLGHGLRIETVLAGQMTHPFFPVPIEVMRAQLTFEDFQAGSTLDLGDGITARTMALNHPDGATAYRLEFDGASLCYVTDTEHVPGSPDLGIRRFIEGADLVIYDSTYSDDEFAAKAGWGHSTWQEGIRLCQSAGVKQLAIFHHDPDHDDEVMARIERAAAEAWSGALVAREGMEVALR